MWFQHLRILFQSPINQVSDIQSLARSTSESESGKLGPFSSSKLVSESEGAAGPVPSP